jgi:hypothetical protein
MQRAPMGQAIAARTEAWAEFTRSGMRLAEFLPWRRFVIRTTWSPEVARTELAKKIGHRAVLFGVVGWGNLSYPFVGSSAGDRFRFRRRIGYRNAFLPVIVADVDRDPRGARVAIAMRMQVFPSIFMAVWMTGATCAAVAGVVAAARGVLPGLVGLVLPLLGGVLCSLAFAYEARQAEGLLRGFFPPVIVPEDTPPYR